MPWHVAKSDQCPASRPWAVIKDADGEVEGCHASEAAAAKQMAALYASEEDDMGRSIEWRSAEQWPDADFELRTEGDGQTLVGYAALFDTPSLPIRHVGVEVIRKGAFTRSLKEWNDITLRYQHDMRTLPLARTTSGTLRLAEDERGLRVDADLPDNEWGRPIRDAITRRDITGMSFGFMPIRTSPLADPPGRAVLEVRLIEVSVVDYPAYPATSVVVREMAEAADIPEDDLRDALLVLRDPEGRLTDVQHRTLMRLINAKSDVPYVHPDIADWRERFAARGVDISASRTRPERSPEPMATTTRHHLKDAA